MKPETPAFVSRLADALGAEDAAAVLAALDAPSSVAVRLHPARLPTGVSPAAFVRDHFSPAAEPVPWNPLGFSLADRPVFTLDPAFHAGAYYVQDASAQFAGWLFSQAAERLEEGPLRVLDLCAAPGGKTTDLAARLRARCGDRFLLVANEVIYKRTGVLLENTGRWGDPCVVMTSCDPAAFSALPGFFDLILADVPCSGEGMFRKDSQAVREWSPETVALCAARQRRILSDVWPALAPGGMLLYATCTFNREENDGNVAWAADSLGAEVLSGGLEMPFRGIRRTAEGFSLLPGFVRGEGQYAAWLRKPEDLPGRPRWKPGRPAPSGSPPAPLPDLFSTPMCWYDRGGVLQAVPPFVDAWLGVLSRLRPLRAGVPVGRVKGKDWVPEGDLAHCMLLNRAAFQTVETTREEALAFLHRDAVHFPGGRGLQLVCHAGLPLGFVKNLGGRSNNLLPMSRRIRMDLRDEETLK